MISLMLDEGVTPTMCPGLHAANVDAYHVRDRKLEGTEDFHLWERAKKENRAVVTINRGDFYELASREKNHPGVVVIPANQKRADQIQFVLSAIGWANGRNTIVPSFKNYFVQVANDLRVTAEYLVLTDEDDNVVVMVPKGSAA